MAHIDTNVATVNVALVSNAFGMPAVARMRQKHADSVLGGELRLARKAAGLSQVDLGVALGIAVASVRQAERGRGAFGSFIGLAGHLGMMPASASLPPGASLPMRMTALRNRLRLGRRAVAAMAGISPMTLAAMERGGGINLSTVVDVASALGASLHLVPIGTAQAYWTATAASSVHHGWTTPPDVLIRLDGVVDGPFGLDPCSPSKGRKAPVHARVHYTAGDDGLSLPWAAATVFMNPPYGRTLRHWVAKAREEVAAGRAGTVFGLVPARSDTIWWHDHVAGHADVWILKGRLSFGDGSAPAPFPSAIVAWGATDTHRARMAGAFPTAWHVPAGRPAGRVPSDRQPPAACSTGIGPGAR